MKPWMISAALMVLSLVALAWEWRRSSRRMAMTGQAWNHLVSQLLAMASGVVLMFAYFF